MFAERLKTLRESMNFNKKQAADFLNLAYTTYVGYESGDREPNSDVLIKIAEKYNVSTDYLLREEMPEDYTSSVPNLYPVETQSFPLLGSVACGEPIFADEELELYVQAGTNIKADFCLRAKGDSMTGARIYDGDVVFVRRQPTVENGEIAVVLIEDEATLKRVHYDREAGVLLLFPENPNYKTMRFSGEELNRIRILGKAIGFQGDVK